MCQQVSRICVGRSTLFIIIKMAALSTDLGDGVYMIVNNIPKDYHTSDLRKFFSSFIETGGFICFHFRHRPEVQKFSGPSQINGKEVSRRVTNCCIIKVKSERASEFLKSYNGEHWLDKKGDTLMTRCFVKKLILHQSSHVSEDVGICKKGTVSSSLSIDKETFSQEDINALIEMHPPTCMPNGNVGTKTVHFLQEIKACRLPPSIITKLGLQFPRNRARRMYTTVPFDYINKRNNQKKNYYSNRIHSRGVWLQALQSSSRDTEEKTEDSESEEEEWDRHEALHDDVTSQERSKERLFEEEIELKWEKGGSGLVFYTDAQFWDAKEGDFDAKTADDWDIDTNIYKNPGMDCDKDSQDLLRMRLEQAVRDGNETKIDRLYDFAAFEKYNKGFGRKLMEAQGWKQGLGIGKNFAGISEPIFNDGQKPTDKKGFGYRGEKLSREPKLKKRRRRSFDSDTSFFISTVYDNPKVSDPPDSVFTSTAYSKLKYRREFLKEHGNL